MIGKKSKKNQGGGLPLDRLFSTMNDGSNLHDNASFYSDNKQFKIDNLIKKSQAESFKNVQTVSDSDEEFAKVELENAVKEYKKNKSKHSETKYDYTSESNKIKESQSFFSKNTDDNDNCLTDLQELMNYFRTVKVNPNKKPVTKSYSNYERQGAIPRWKTKDNSSEVIQPKASEINSKKKLRKQKYEKKPEIYFEKNRTKNESFCIGTKMAKTESSLYSFVVNSQSDDVIVKINEEICSTPFFYMVPNNPSPNFFFSPGSYYVIPKKPSSLHEKIIIFHPEKTTSTGYEKDYTLPKLEKKLDRITTKCTNSSYESFVPSMNNLGKEVSRKEDSHLNISPLDAKLNESSSNLETSCAQNKTYEKALLNPVNSDTLNLAQKTKPKMELTQKLAHRAEKICIKIDEDGLMKNADRIEVLNSPLLQKDEKNLNENNAESYAVERIERQRIGQKPTVEFLETDKFIEVDIIHDEFDTKEELISTYEEQLERMALALPEIRIEELQEKLFEFEGDEELIESYIQEAKRVMRSRQRVLDLQFILPDADPDFLHQEVEKFENDDSKDAINALIEKLLDSNAYPRIFENNENSERRSLWRKYVQNFSVKSFMLKVSNPRNFADPERDHSRVDEKLILKFLISRYPSESQDFLKESLKSNNNNLTKTCLSLAHLEAVRLSESSFQHEAFNEDFLKEVCYIDHKEEIDNYLEEMEERKTLEIEEARLNDTFLSCPLCMEVELIASEAVTCPEGHVFCKECIKRYIFVKLSDGIYRFLCPLDKCDAFFLQTTLEELLSESVLSSIIKKQQSEEISNAKLDGLEFCPYCEFACIPNPEDKIFKCQNPECLNQTCRKCQQKNHIPLRCEEIERPMDVEARKKIEETMTEQLIRSCPKCGKKFVKIDGCNKILCSCGTVICYICRKQINGYDHFKENSYLGTCPLYSNNQTLHVEDVVEAGIQARNDILKDNPNIRIMHDPTTN